MATLKTRDLIKRFGQIQVMHGIDLDIADGEFVVLVGPSGCGKSTLLRMIAGLEEVSGGELWIGDDRVEHLPPQKRDVAMVFQSYALFPHMTVRENIAYGPKVRGEPGDKVEPAAEMLNLTPYLDRYPRELSGGQRQRVAMGRALQREPRLFLFDEPLSNLDAQLRVAMRAEIKALHSRLQNTVVYVTHDQIEAMTMADRIVVMRDGRIEQQGAPLDIYDRPANIFVAGFIGSPAMSFLRGRVTSGQLSLGNQQIPVGVRDGDVVIGVRPEGFQRTDDTSGLEVEVRVIEPMGPETHVLANLVDETLVYERAADTASDIRAVLRIRVKFAPGARQFLTVEPDALHLFDPETGARLEN
jgi:multiple sugar transport system ATP-binding protein